MNITIDYILISLLAYIIGSIPFALIYVRILLGKDMRQFGSKNTGALNTLRIVSHEKGKKWGISSFLFVFLLDAFKAVLAVIIAMHFIDNQVIAMTLGTFFAILGHNYSIFLKFKGGRGAASLMGVFLYLNPIVFVGWIVLVVCFMFLAEILMGGIINKKFAKNAVSEQIIGRILGEIYAAWWISIFAPALFYPALLGTILIIIAHKDRIEKQIKNIKDKKYFND